MRFGPDQVVSASTREIPPGRKLDHWREVFYPIWGEVEIIPTQGKCFDAAIRSVPVGDLRFNRISYRGHAIRRTRQHIARLSEGFFVLACPTRGHWHMNLGRQELDLVPGRLYLLTNEVPYESHDLDGYDTLNVMIPTKLLGARVAHLDPVFEAPTEDGPRLVSILFSYFRALFDALPSAGPEEAAFIQDHLLDLLAFAVNDAGRGLASEDSSVLRAHRGRALQFIRSNLHNEDLDASAIAGACGLSLSYLYKVFEGSGRTVREHLREERLRRAHAMVTSPAFAGLSLSEIAHRNGFRSLAHFSRSFKQRFGDAPGNCRWSPPARG